MTHSVGFQKRELHDPALGEAFPYYLFYPTTAATEVHQVGPFSLSVALDARPAAGSFPLSLISHGSGGTPMTHRGLAMALAQQGRMVVLPQHLHNHRFDNRWEKELDNLRYRPRHLQLLKNALLADEQLAPSLDGERISVLGHSLGGYTALALAGAKAQIQVPGEAPILLDTPYDPMIRSIVLISPSIQLFMHPDGLPQLATPLLLYLSSLDPYVADLPAYLENHLPANAPLTTQIVANAGPYSFLTPFPPHLKGRVGPAAADPEGFDREAFHQQMYREVDAFLQQAGV